MKTLGIGCLLVIVVVALIVAAAAWSGHNNLVRLSRETDQAWARILDAYRLRADLVTNLVATVAGAANVEEVILTEVTEARAAVGQVKIDPGAAPGDPAAIKAFQEAQGALSSALGGLVMATGRFPELRATDGFRDLQAQLEETENRIATERERFNEAVLEFNLAVRQLPGALWARLFGYPAKPYLAAEGGFESPLRALFDVTVPPAAAVQP